MYKKHISLLQGEGSVTVREHKISFNLTCKINMSAFFLCLRNFCLICYVGTVFLAKRY